MNARDRLRGVYAITDATVGAPETLTARVEAALQGGVRLVQYRDKSLDDRRRRHEARALVTLCKAYRVPLIVNDDIELAAHAGADGVHLGEHDATLAFARERLGDEAIIGISCYDSIARAHEAVEQGADYVAFGAIFPSSTKPAARRAGLDILRRAQRGIPVPVCAIGGIDHRNAAEAAQAGADMIAVIAALFGGGDIRENARELRRAFECGAERRRGTVSCSGCGRGNP